MASERRLQILCLHGYRQNDVFFREKTGSLRKMIKKYADLHYACAPHRPNVESSEERGDVRGWWFTKADSQFSSRDVTDLAIGFDDSVEYLVKYIKENGPFDGLLGFSQGACMLHLMLAKMELGEVEISKPQFVMFASGFLSLSSLHAQYTSLRLLTTPSLHIFGTGDEVVLYPVSERLRDQFRPEGDSSSVVDCSSEIRHDGGHFIPPMSRYKEPLIAFLEQQLAQKGE
ncbi:hypothetical protein PRIPAC_88626 [Pristionchus pacificus]|uniref:FSH1 domain-containing protein n=1 Tax=Pristionchus pacificus TaxID=54126 RepID=A0A2A6B5U7_PRIPA|nr:hypothetical protein PRIPAC_88626 [Pristionchus pacificus]|eukprot:PDM61254.1 hypothetical protein PRIPAC_50696 [Pristionchus pacificus]